MVNFDSCIGNVRENILLLEKKENHVKKVKADIDNHRYLSLLQASKDRKKAPSIVLKSDMYMELGSAVAGSCAMTLYTNQSELVEDGRITIIGQDINETLEKQLPFAQIILIGGEEITSTDYYSILQSQNISGLIPGYMIKSTSDNIWCRISKEAAMNGFCFEYLGNVLIHHLHSQMDKVQKVEVIFVTSTKADVQELNKIGTTSKEIWRQLKKQLWQDRGLDILECKPGGHCGACEDKAICEEIKKIGNSYQNIERRASCD